MSLPLYTSKGILQCCRLSCATPPFVLVHFKPKSNDFSCTGLFLFDHSLRVKFCKRTFGQNPAIEKLTTENDSSVGVNIGTFTKVGLVVMDGH